MLSSSGDGGSLQTLDASVVQMALIASAAHKASEGPVAGDQRRGPKLLPAGTLR